jgi:hypothetical protein
MTFAANLCTILALGQTPPPKNLPLPGTTFAVAGRSAFLIAPAAPPAGPQRWVWYAPTLPAYPEANEKWMFEKFLAAGIAIAGIDVGESYGSPAGRDLFTQFHQEMTGKRGFAKKPVLLGRSRGGRMALAWAADHPELVAGFAGIYPVCNVASYPGIDKACGAYGLTAAALKQQLPQHNPVDRAAALAKARLPLFAIHGDIDKLVPLELNSGLLDQRIRTAGGPPMQLIVPKGQGHSFWQGFFQCQELVDFVAKHAQP